MVSRSAEASSSLRLSGSGRGGGRSVSTRLSSLIGAVPRTAWRNSSAASSCSGSAGSSGGMSSASGFVSGSSGRLVPPCASLASVAERSTRLLSASGTTPAIEARNSAASPDASGGSLPRFGISGSGLALRGRGTGAGRGFSTSARPSSAMGWMPRISRRNSARSSASWAPLGVMVRAGRGAGGAGRVMRHARSDFSVSRPESLRRVIAPCFAQPSESR